MRTGQQFPVLWASIALIVLLPTLVYLVLGSPMHWEYPVLRGFNFQGGMVMQPEFLALLLGLSIYNSAFLAEIFRANVIDASTEHFVFELTGRTAKIEQFISIMTELGLVEVSRTGIAAISRGPKGM